MEIENICITYPGPLDKDGYPIYLIFRYDHVNAIKNGERLSKAE